MNRISVISFAAILLSASIAGAQGYSSGYSGDYPNPPYPVPPYMYSHHSSTVAEGIGRGLADLIRSGGEFNYLSSQAAINLEEARRRDLENQKLWTQTYFDVRRINREGRDAERGRRLNKDDWIRYAQMGMPQRLSPGELDSVTGAIAWPILLRSADFAQQRTELDGIFAQRAVNGAISADNFLKVHKSTSAMLAELRNRIREYPAPEYLAARRFLESLTYEASLPVA